MKIVYAPTEQITCEFEANSPAQFFEKLSVMTTLFEDSKCGQCSSPELMFQTSVRKGYTFYERKCRACGAVLRFGQAKEGGRLFPRRKDQEGRAIGVDGWHHFKPTTAAFDDGPPTPETVPSHSPVSARPTSAPTNESHIPF